MRWCGVRRVAFVIAIDISPIAKASRSSGVIAERWPAPVKFWRALKVSRSRADGVGKPGLIE
jgi:hypothetical protein